MKLLQSIFIFVVISIFIITIGNCATISEQTASFPKPKVVPHSQWEAFPRVGFPADAMRRNIAPGESLDFKDLKLEILAVDSVSIQNEKAHNFITLRLSKDTHHEIKKVEETSAFNWQGFHIAILAVHIRKGELGQGLTEFEICTMDSMPAKYANATIAGDASYRAWIPQEITMITLHHSGDPKPMTLQDDPIKHLRALQTWGKNAKNWWDVPYHFLIMPDGTIYEGRDYHYMGETNTSYNPMGHFLICCEGNYEIQEPSPAVLKSIEDLMAWAVSEYHVPLDHIYGHYQLAQTDCPGKNLKKYLEDGTFVKAVKERLHMK
jgi:hypothetical protein